MPIDPRDIEICLGSDDAASVAPPIEQSAIFPKASLRELLDGLAAEHIHHVYTRGQNPTVEVLERQIANLERAEACKCFGSGMAAISAVMLGLLQSGDHVLFVNQVYGPTLQLARHLERFGIAHEVVLDLNLTSIERSIRPSTRLIWFESPGTMLFRTLDIEGLTALAREHQITTAMDNSWATPLFQKPITMGVDLVMHACSKYLAGHSDVIAGALAGSRALLERIFYRAFLLNGGVLHPFDAWLVNRGLKTLPARMRQLRDDALVVASWLRDHPAVARVHHPGGVNGYDAANCSGLFAFELADARFSAVERVIDRLRLFRTAVSWGGTESLVVTPNRGHNEEDLRAQDVSPGLIRLSVGLEGATALCQDLDDALKHD